MKHIHGILVLALVLAAPLFFGADARAASEQITQELHVTAIVPHHRDIIIDRSGKISEIVSNTAEDVMPTVYLGSVSPKNRKPLTDALYKQYREKVPEGTGKSGILYRRGLPVSILLPKDGLILPVYNS